MKTLRLFYATRKDAQDYEVASVVTSLQRAVTQLTQGAMAVEVTSAKQDFEARFAQLGGWDAWILDVAAGVRYDDRQPRFHAFAVTDLQVGRATAGILRAALERKKLVLWFSSDTGKLHRVGQIAEDDPTNWQQGWSVILDT